MRGACHIEDGKDVGVDLTGGFHDAGDHVKFCACLKVIRQRFLAGLFMNTGCILILQAIPQKMLSTLKYFTDYFLKSHPDANTFYYQCGEGEEDHKYWMLLKTNL
jgi:hypothetical protein